jgi:hypothetical protein
LPLRWYDDVAVAALSSGSRRRRPAALWPDAIGSSGGVAARFARGPRRVGIAQHARGRLQAPTVGAMHEWGDPLPGLRCVLDHPRRPRAFIRPFLSDREMRGRDGRPQLLEDPGHGGSTP